jgi:ATP-dependent helicase/nuclease subunit B
VGATASSEVSLRATYLALDGTKAIDEVEHPDVRTSAVALVEGLADDLRRLRAGAGLPALGEGATCDYCAARGICRRDHWSGS